MEASWSRLKIGVTESQALRSVGLLAKLTAQFQGLTPGFLQFKQLELESGNSFRQLATAVTVENCLAGHAVLKAESTEETDGDVT